MNGRSIDDLVASVVRNGNCSGCGMCTLIDRGREMQPSPDAFQRPVRQAVAGHAATLAAAHQRDLARTG